MAVSVTPWSVAPLALPGPHGEARVPKVFDDDDDDDDDDDVVVELPDDAVPERLLLQAAASSPSARTAVNPRNHHLKRCTKPSPCSGSAAGR